MTILMELQLQKCLLEKKQLSYKIVLELILCALIWILFVTLFLSYSPWRLRRNQSKGDIHLWYLPVWCRMWWRCWGCLVMCCFILLNKIMVNNLFLLYQLFPKRRHFQHFLKSSSQLGKMRATITGKNFCSWTKSWVSQTAV